MRFIAKVAPLAQALKAAEKVVNSRTTIPILMNALISADDGMVTIRTTDLETIAEYKIPAAVIESGSTTVPAKLLAEYVGALPLEELEMIGNDGAASIRCDESQLNLVTLKSDDFPLPPSGITEKMRNISGETLSKAISETAFAMATSDAQGVAAKGGCLEIGKRGLRMTGTDGYRLARHERGEIDESTTLVVPVSGLKTIANSFKESPTLTLSTVGDKENYLVADDGVNKVMVRLLQTPYPDVTRLLKTKAATTANIKRENLVLALKRAGLMADTAAKSLALQIDEKELEIHVESNTHGIGHEILSVNQKGPGIRLAVNAQYFVETLNHIDTENVQIGFSGRLGPIMIEGEGEALTSRYLLMPLQS